MYLRTDSIFILSKSKILFTLFLFLPFTHIVNMKLSLVYAYGIIFTLIIYILLVILFQKEYKIRKSPILFLASFNIVIIFLYHSVILQESLYSFIFFCTGMLFTILISFYKNLFDFIQLYYRKLALYYFLVIFFSIFIDFIFLKSGNPHFQLMYDVTRSGYLYRPLGVFGQPSINSGLLVVFYLLYMYKTKDEGIKLSFFKKYSLFAMLTLGIIVQGSGTGFLIYSMYILFRYYNNPYLLIFLFVGIVGILFSNVIDKMSLEYLSVIAKHTLEAFYLLQDFTLMNFFFGKGDIAAVDSGFIAPIYGVGIFYLMLILYICKTMFKKIEIVTLGLPY